MGQREWPDRVNGRLFMPCRSRRYRDTPKKILPARHCVVRNQSPCFCSRVPLQVGRPFGLRQASPTPRLSTVTRGPGEATVRSPTSLMGPQPVAIPSEPQKYRARTFILPNLVLRFPHQRRNDGAPQMKVVITIDGVRHPLQQAYIFLGIRPNFDFRGKHVFGNLCPPNFAATSTSFATYPPSPTPPSAHLHPTTSSLPRLLANTRPKTPSSTPA